jgi:tetratricopeptide (TPR) repeat protein
MRILIIIPLLLFLQASLMAQQAQKPEDLFNDAIFFYNMEEYKEAGILFEQLLIDNPENANLNFYAGMSFINVKGSEKKAIPYLEHAVKYTDIKAKKRNFREKKAPHHAWFYLGNAYRINNQLDKALDSYQKFQNIKNFDRHYNLRIVEEEIKSCERAKIIQDSPLQLILENPGEPLNTAASEYNPVLSADENIIIYVSSQRFYEAIMQATRTGRSWGTPVNITSQLGSDGDMFPTSLSPDGRELYLVKRNRSGGDIYVSTFDGTLWTKATSLNSNINTRADEAHASLSPDGRFLYISSSRRGGFGGLDLYVSERQSNGDWGPAINLGSTINTPENETSPFLSADGSTLFFSSTAHFNMGGYDIFFTRKNTDGVWENPINIGYPINTTNDDLFFFPTGNNQTGYFAIYDDENGMGQEDIYRVEIIASSLAPPAENRFNQSFRIKLTEEASGEFIEIYYDKKTDAFRVKGVEGKNYSIEVEAK